MLASDQDNPEVALIPVTARNAKNLTVESWWNSDGSMDCGAGPLAYRCMREYYWSKEYTVRVLKGYRQFLELKKILEDWDAKILAPSPPVNQMWHQHILDVANYCHDCLLICGRVVGNDPDSALDEWALEKKMVATKQLLRARFEREIDTDIWRFDDHGPSERASLAAAASRPKGDVAARGESAHPTASMCVSGLTAEEKKSEQFVEDKRRFQADVYGYGWPSDFDAGRFQSAASFPIIDEKKEDNASSSRSRSTKQDSVVIHELQDKEIEVEEQETYRIRVRTLKGAIYSLMVNKHMTIREVKSLIERQHGVPEDKQHLLYYGKALEDRLTLEECAIPAESGLQLLVRSKKPAEVTAF
jgi:hypothetical protein